MKKLLIFLVVGAFLVGCRGTPEAVSPAPTVEPSPTEEIEEPTPTPVPTATPVPPSPTPTSEPTPTPVPEYVGVPAVDLAVIDACIDQGFVCLPIPFEPQGVVITEYLVFFDGEMRGKKITAGVLGIAIEPGTVVVAPFSGRIFWALLPICNPDEFPENPEDIPPEAVYDWECYNFNLTLETFKPPSSVNLCFLPVGI